MNVVLFNDKLKLPPNKLHAVIGYSLQIVSTLRPGINTSKRTSSSV